VLNRKSVNCGSVTASDPNQTLKTSEHERGRLRRVNERVDYSFEQALALPFSFAHSRYKPSFHCGRLTDRDEEPATRFESSLKALVVYRQ